MVAEAQSADRSSRNENWVGEQEHWAGSDWAWTKLYGRRSAVVSSKNDFIFVVFVRKGVEWEFFMVEY
jgi:hypothetical protein